MRWLKALVIIMGILIIIGVIVMAVGIGHKFSNSGMGTQPDWSSIPPSSHIIDWIAIDDKLILVIQKHDKEILFYTVHGNQLKSKKPLKIPFSYQSKE